MVGKRVQFDDETWNAINLLRQERRRSFQQLATEAFRDLLAKHHRAVGLKAQLRESFAQERAKAEEQGQPGGDRAAARARPPRQ
jgi:hypothetical protein